MKNLSKEKRERILLIVIGTAIILIGAWYGIIGLQKTKLVEIRKSIGDQQTKVDNAKRLVSTHAALEKRLGDATERLHKLETQMAAGDMYSWFILRMNKFRVGYNVDIPQFSREVTGEVQMLPRFPYRAATFTVRGTAYFHDFGKFLADFENAFPQMRVQNLELEPASSSNANRATEPEKIAFRMEIVALINPTVS